MWSGQHPPGRGTSGNPSHYRVPTQGREISQQQPLQPGPAASQPHQHRLREGSVLTLVHSWTCDITTHAVTRSINYQLSQSLLCFSQVYLRNIYQLPLPPWSPCLTPSPHPLLPGALWRLMTGLLPQILPLHLPSSRWQTEPDPLPDEWSWSQLWFWLTESFYFQISCQHLKIIRTHILIHTGSFSRKPEDLVK